MTHGSLFSGVGGFDLAAEWAGFENLFHCELNQFCQKVLKHHFPNSESYEDITKTDFRKWRGKIDVLSGGFPCQPFSVAGSRKGADDDRYLWPQMLRAIEEISPTWVIGENVTGILTMVLPGKEVEMGDYTDVTGESYKEIEERQMYVVERICSDLEHIGYSVQPIVIPACAVGAPHRRDRIWFVAENTVSIRCDREIREKESCFRRFGEPCTRDYERIHSKENVTSNRSDARIEIRCSGKDEVSAIGFTFHTDSKLLQSRNNKEYEMWGNKKITTESFYFSPNWEKFPTQSPVCDRNDGIPLGLAGISFSKWRQEAIKSLGNAIVPQVAYEIFKTIKNIELI